MIVTCARPWLTADLGQPHRVLSWAPHRGGLVRARHILWREVRNADLPEGFDVTGWLAAEMAARHAGDAVCFLTSREVSAHHHARVTVGGLRAEALATAGLSNAEAVGTRRRAPDPVPGAPYGTINIAVQLHTPLTGPALIEALTIAAEARTAAVMEGGLMLPTGRATGTGTDCLALATPREGAPPLAHCGLHTAAGEAIGAAVRQAVTAAVAEWRAHWAALGRLAPDGRLLAGP